MNGLLAEQITLDQAAELMAVSAHATLDACTAAYQDRKVQLPSPMATVARKPVNATSEAVIADVVHLAGTRYQGVNHTHLS